MKYARLLGERYTPLYFLNALVAGGFALTAYMYLYWICKLGQGSIPTFETLWALFSGEKWGQKLIAAPLLGLFLFFSYLHARLLIWNHKNLVIWRTMVPFKALMGSKDKTVLLTIPATLAITVLLVLLAFLMFFPYAPLIKDYALPVVVVALLFVSGRSVLLYGELLASTLGDKNSANGLPGSPIGQLLSVFSFMLLALPFALIAQNSEIQLTIFASVFAAFLLLALAGFILVFRFATQYRCLFDGDLAPEVGSLYWFASGILCIGAVVFIQIDGGLSRLFHTSQDASSLFLVCGTLALLIGTLGFIGYALLKRHNVQAALLEGKLYAPSFYALLCPILGIGIVYGYFVNIVLTQASVSEPLSFIGFVLHTPLIALQGWGIRRMMRLNDSMFKGTRVKKA